MSSRSLLTGLVVFNLRYPRYCKEYRGSSKDVKYKEEDPEQERACKEADGFVSKTKSERLDLLLVTNTDDKENVASKGKTEELAQRENVVVKNMDSDGDKKVSMFRF